MMSRTVDSKALTETQQLDRKSTRLNSSHGYISYAVFCLKKKTPSIRCRRQHVAPAEHTSAVRPASRPLFHVAHVKERHIIQGWPLGRYNLDQRSRSTWT